MKKDEELSQRDKQEKAWTQKRVHYHNRQAKGTEVWMEQAQEVLRSKMEEAHLVQLFVPLHLNEVPSTEFLFVNARLNKIHSMYCDLYEELPFRPDMAFDVVWRSFEVMSKYYSRVVWKDPDIKDKDMFLRVSQEVIVTVMKDNSQLEKAFNQLFEAIPDATLRFMIVRLFVSRDLSVLSQLSPIRERAKKILSENLYNAFYETFFEADGGLPYVNQLKAVGMMRSILKGEAVELEGETFKPIELEVRIELLISCVLYVSRCERYHGDYVSQFKSNLAKMVTYHNFYYLLTITDLLFWMVWYKFAGHQGLGQIFGLEELAACSEQRRKNLDVIFG
jgi:hypothetical protein